jgi:hypothetical protein
VKADWKDLGDADCECLTFAVRDIESFARGRLTQALEYLVIRFLITVAGRRSRRTHEILVPDFSLGPFQLKLSTVARLRPLPFERDGRRIRLDRNDAITLVEACMTESTAFCYARRRIAEATAVRTSQRLDDFSAVALVYAGELPTSRGTPYQTRLRVRFLMRHSACLAQSEPSVSGLGPRSADVHR